MASKSGVSVNPECTTAYQDLKLGHKHKYIIYKISDDGTEFVVDQTGTGDWDEFRKTLINAKSKDKSGKEGHGPRFAVFDLEYQTEEGATRNKIVFLSWIPDNAPIRLKMIYASSRDALRQTMDGIGIEVQGTDAEEIEEETVVDKARRGRS